VGTPASEKDFFIFQKGRSQPDQSGHDDIFCTYGGFNHNELLWILVLTRCIWKQAFYKVTSNPELA
jgi:hypothetical protein